MSFSHFGELWLPESHSGGYYFRVEHRTKHPTWEKMPTIQITPGKKLQGEARWAVGSGRASVGKSEFGAAASRKAVWWDLRLASLLTHLLSFAPTAKFPKVTPGEDRTPKSKTPVDCKQLFCKLNRPLSLNQASQSTKHIHTQTTTFTGQPVLASRLG